MKCPKCKKEAWVVTVVRVGKAPGTSYTYDRYRHYVGTRRAITLSALQKVLMEVFPAQADAIMAVARKRTGERTLDHYVRRKP